MQIDTGQILFAPDQADQVTVETTIDRGQILFVPGETWGCLMENPVENQMELEKNSVFDGKKHQIGLFDCVETWDNCGNQ